MNYQLSICIPTYNRARHLLFTLENIYSNITSDVEVVVYDGASTDHTEQILQEWGLRHSNFTYHIAENNGGVDKDIEHVVSLARADYCWLMSSDDYITSDSIFEILKITKKHSPNVLLFDRTNCNKNMQVKSEENWLDVENDVNSYTFTLIEELDNYLNKVRNLGGLFSYMSSIVIKKSDWLKYAGNPKLLGTNYNHVGNILKVLRNGGSLIYFKKSLVLCREDNDSFSSNGLPSRFLIDFKGYYEIGQEIFRDNLVIKDKFYGVLRRDHHILRLIKIRSYCQSIEEWAMIEKYLIKLNYSPFSIKFSRYFGLLSGPVKLIFYLRTFFLKWRD